MKKDFIITIDTEGDNLWERATTKCGIRDISVKNSHYIQRFQSLCEKYNFIPTYLVDYEMMESDYFCGKAKEWIKDGKCEIGMHMHAWNTPPYYKLPYYKRGHNPYAGEYPREIMIEKIKNMTNTICERLEIQPTSHRGGRWYIDKWYISALKRFGYFVDCTITPGISWVKCYGNKVGGCDYTKYPAQDFYMDSEKKMLQVPPTIISAPLVNRVKAIIREPYEYAELINEKIWLRPNGKNLDDLIYISKHERFRNIGYIEFMIHSSELMPGGSPTFQKKEDIDKLYYDIETLFAVCKKNYEGIALSDYAIKKQNERDDVTK